VVKVFADKLGYVRLSNIVPKHNRNFFILKPLLVEVVEISKPVFQNVPANETVLAMPANETYPVTHTSCSLHALRSVVCDKLHSEFSNTSYNLGLRKNRKCCSHTIHEKRCK
jgi:hypothetical protein